MTKENNGWISVNSIKKDKIPLLTPLYIKTKNSGVYVGFLYLFPTEDNFDYIDEDGNEFIYKWEVPEISSTFPFNEVESYIPVPEVNDILPKTNWINVKDKLPDLHPHKYYGMFSDHILLYGIYDGRDIPQIFIGYMVKGNIFYSTEYGKCEEGGVTHWQPLPPIPTK